MNTPWPPVIGIARVPWWARLRDAVLTALAWIALLSALSPLGIALWSDLQAALGLSEARMFHLAPAWKVIRPCLRLAVLLSLLLAAFAIVRRHLYLTKRREMAQLPALLRVDELDRLEVPAEHAARLRSNTFRSCGFRRTGRIADLGGE